MFKRTSESTVESNRPVSSNWPRFRLPAISLGAGSLLLLFLAIEFFDELHYTIDGAVLPVLRTDLGLTYAQIGLLLGLPALIGVLIEPVLMLLGDTRLRRSLIVGGGAALMLALVWKGSSGTFPMLLAAVSLSFPASGAFVTLAQATLMDLHPGREAQMMARWTAAGSLGNVLGPLAVAAAFSLGLSWRWIFFALGGLALVLILGVLVRPFPKPAAAEGQEDDPAEAAVRPGVLLANLKLALRQPQILRWLVLLEFSDLMEDVFTGYAPLYFTDAVGVTPVQASLVLTLLLGLGLVSDLILIPLLERISGRRVVRITAGLTLLVYPAFLLAPWLPVKLALLALIPFTTMGWYQVLQGETFAAVPGRSGTVMALTSFAGLVNGFLAWAVGAFANTFGLPAAMWLLLLGPLALALWTPMESKQE